MYDVERGGDWIGLEFEEPIDPVDFLAGESFEFTLILSIRWFKLSLSHPTSPPGLLPDVPDTFSICCRH